MKEGQGCKSISSLHGCLHLEPLAGMVKPVTSGKVQLLADYRMLGGRQG